LDLIDGYASVTSEDARTGRQGTLPCIYFWISCIDRSIDRSIDRFDVWKFIWSTRASTRMLVWILRI